MISVESWFVTRLGSEPVPADDSQEKRSGSPGIFDEAGVKDSFLGLLYRAAGFRNLHEKKQHERLISGARQGWEAPVPEGEENDGQVHAEGGCRPRSHSRSAHGCGGVASRALLRRRRRSPGPQG